MSQALAALSRNLIPLLVCITLAACNGSYTAFETDVDFNTDQKTADIEQNNAELMTLAAYQSAFLGHYQSAAYKFLDASDLPAVLCSNGGTALYTYSRNAAEVHEVGDSIAVSYDNCIEGDSKYNGTMTGTYSKIKGLNQRFVNIDTSQCLAKLQGNLNIANTFFDIIDYDSDNDYFLLNDDQILYPGAETTFDSSKAISLPGDDIRFTRVGSRLKVDILSLNAIDTEEDGEELVTRVDLSFYISKGQSVIFILRPNEPVDGMVTSIDGDQLYTVVDLVVKKENCQNFERTINVHFDNFSTEKIDFLTTSLNGAVTLLDSQETANRVNQSFINSNFTTTVMQGNTTEVYTMKDYNVQQSVNIVDGAYYYVFDGLISNANLLKGQVALTAGGRLLGNFNSTYPKTGAFEVEGQGLERIFIIPDNLKVSLRVDYNGDSTGNGFGDFDIIINTTWDELFNREFKE